MRAAIIRFLIWLLLPGFHLAKNPPAGQKKPRKAEETRNRIITETAINPGTGAVDM